MLKIHTKAPGKRLNRSPLAFAQERDLSIYYFSKGLQCLSKTL